MKTLVSIVVPFFNEQDNVVPLYENVAAVFEMLPDYEYECIFVDDGSTDATASRLAELRTRDGRVRPLHMARNAGQSAALIAGMRAARGMYLLTLDGDLQNDPADFPALLELLKEFDSVFGYRVDRNDTWLRRVASRVANRVRNAVLHDGIRDSGCGIKGFRRQCVRHLVAFNGIHRFLAVFIRAQGFTLIEHPVRHHARHAGVSKYGINNRLWRGLFDLVGVAWLGRRQVFVDVRPDEPEETRLVRSAK